MAATDLVEPKVETEAPVAPAPEEAPAEAAPAPEASLPDEVLQIPAIQGLITGEPAAVSAPLKEFSKRGEAEVIAKNSQSLMKAGMGFYRSLDGQIGVVFNQMYLPGETLKQADQAGKLLEVAPPFDTVNEALGKTGLAHPALASGGPPAGPAVSGPPETPQAAQAPMQAGAAPLPASAQRKLMSARVTNMQQGSPTSGPSPGAGRLLNSILKPVV